MAIIILSTSAGPAVGPVTSGPILASPDPPRARGIGPAVTGYAPWFYYIDGLVNAANGNLYFTQEDLRVNAIGLDQLRHQVVAYRERVDPVRTLAVVRAYNSGDASVDGPFGFGWTHTYNVFLANVASDPELHDATGAKHVFVRSGSTFTPPPGVHDRLNENPIGTFTLWRKDGSSALFDSLGVLTAILDHVGNRLDLTYAGGRLATVTGYRGLSLAMTYDAMGHVTQVADAPGRTIDYIYDASGDLVQAVDPAGNAWRYRYDGSHRLVDAINRVGVGQRFVYGPDGVDGTGLFLYDAPTDTSTAVLRTNTILYGDDHAVVIGATGGTTLIRTNANGNPVMIVDAGSGTSRFDWDADMNIVGHQNANGPTFTYAYDARGNLVQVTDPVGGVITKTWLNIDQPLRYASLLQTFTNRRGIGGSMSYDGSGNVISVALPLGYSLSYTYDAEGNLLTAVDARGIPRTFTHDFALQTLTVADGSLPSQRFEYDAVGRLVRTVSPLGNPRDYVYDATDNVVSTTDALGGATTYARNAEGSLLSTTDALGRTRTMSHNALGRPFDDVDALGNRESYSYDLGGNVVTRVDRSGGITTFEYDALDRMTRRTDAAGKSSTYAYDAVGNLLRVTDALGRTTTYTYDALDRLTAETDPLGGVARSEYDPEGNPTREIRKDGTAVTTTYDALDRIVRITEPLGLRTSYEYDGNGNLVRHTDPNGRQTVRAYDDADRLIRVTDAMGFVQTLAYDGDGNLASFVDPLGATTTYAYDALDRLSSVQDALGGVTSYTYDAIGNRLSRNDPRGATESYTYDGEDRLLTETDPLGGTVSYAYDPRGNLLSVTDRNGNPRTYTYDALGRVLEAFAGPNRRAAFAYDAVGNRISATDGNGEITTYAYDALNRLRSERDPLGGTTTYSYDRGDRLVGLTDANGHTTRYVYDPAGRLRSVVSPLGNGITYGYDPAGNLVFRADPDGRTTRYSYDALNRLVGKAYSSGATVSYAYDAAGNLRVIADRSSLGTDEEATFLYDALGRRRMETRTYPAAPGLAARISRSVSYAYDAVGNRVGLTYPDGSRVTYTYDAANRLIEMRDPFAGTFTFSYDAGGRRTGLVRAGAGSTTYAYDAEDRVTSIVHRTPAGVPFESYQHTYDGVGNRLTTENLAGQVTTYAYDAAGRLASVTSPSGGRTQWTYDAVGNRVLEDASGRLTAYTYDADNRLLRAGARTYAYDRSGNLVGHADVFGITIYEYDPENRLVRVRQPGGRSVEYRYAGDGVRLARTAIPLLGAPATTTYYMYAGDDVVEERNPGAAGAIGPRTGIRYVHGPSVDEPLARVLGGVSQYYATDTLGSVTSLLSGAGAVIQTYAYDAWGRRVATSGQVANPFQFSAREFDEQTRMYYFRARWYTPDTGRFTSKDPLPSGYPLVRGDDRSLYTYVGNNPVNLVDPTGHDGEPKDWSTTFPGLSAIENKARLEMIAVLEGQAIERRKGLEIDLIDEIERLRRQQRLDDPRAPDPHALLVGPVDIWTWQGVRGLRPFDAMDLPWMKALLGGASMIRPQPPNSGKVAPLPPPLVITLSEIRGESFFRWHEGFRLPDFRLPDLFRLQDPLDEFFRWLEAYQEAARQQAWNEFFRWLEEYQSSLTEIDVVYDTEIVEMALGGISGTTAGTVSERPWISGTTAGTVVDTEILSLSLFGGLPQSRGGRSMDGLGGPTDGALTDVPFEIDPPLIVPITVNVANFGPSTLSGAVFQVRVFKEPGNRSVLLVVDESDGAHAWFEEALADIGVAYDIVFVDTEYTPVYEDADPLTKDLKDYDIVLWETSNDRTGTLAAPAQPELGKYLADEGCLFVGGDGFMAEWPARSGTLMADWMFADGYGGDTLDFAVDGVRGTIGDGLAPVLAGGTGSSLQAFGTSLQGVKPPGQAAFLYDRSLAAIQGGDATANGTYKTVLFSFSFDSISERSLRDTVMRRVVDYLACKPVASGGTGVPDIPWPIPRDPPWPPTGGPPKVPVTTNIPLPPGWYIGELFLYTPGPDTNRLNNGGRSRLGVKLVEITTCRSITQAGVYLVTQDLSTTASCLSINVDDVTLYGGGHTITFGIGGSGVGITLSDNFGPDLTNVFVSDFVLTGSGFGVNVFKSTSNVEIRNMKISGTNIAVRLNDAHGVTITDIDATGNIYGVYVTITGPPPPSTPLTVVFNNIFANTYNAGDPSYYTKWNADAIDCSRTNIVGGPCIGGNFWSDYTGVDLDGDFIGDTNLPYNSNGNIAVGGDFLPLIIP